MLDDLFNERIGRFPTRRTFMVGVVALMLVFAGCAGGDGNATTSGGGGGGATTGRSSVTTTGITPSGGGMMTTGGGGTTTPSGGAMTTGSGGMITSTTLGSTSTVGTVTSPSMRNMTPAGPLAGTPVENPAYRRRFKTGLRVYSIQRKSLTVEGNTVALTYVSTATPQRKQFTIDVATVAGIYANLVRRGWDVKRLNATVVTPTGETVATWSVTSSWARQSNDIGHGPREFLDRINTTVETPSSVNGAATGTSSTT